MRSAIVCSRCFCATNVLVIVFEIVAFFVDLSLSCVFPCDQAEMAPVQIAERGQTRLRHFIHAVHALW